MLNEVAKKAIKPPAVDDSAIKEKCTGLFNSYDTSKDSKLDAEELKPYAEIAMTYATGSKPADAALTAAIP